MWFCTFVNIAFEFYSRSNFPLTCMFANLFFEQVRGRRCAQFFPILRLRYALLPSFSQHSTANIAGQVSSCCRHHDMSVGVRNCAYKNASFVHNSTRDREIFFQSSKFLSYTFIVFF